MVSEKMRRLKDTVVEFLCWALNIAVGPFTHTPLNLPPEPSFLIIKPCCLGDVLMATAAIGQLRKAYPKSRIAFAVGDWAKEVIVHCPNVDEIVSCGRVGAGVSFNWSDYISLVQNARKGNYDACLVLDRSPLLTLVPFLAGIKHRIGLNSRYR